ncbi:MAG: lysophospholipid acyltransferase family protein [Actinobacteria bacterium]|nr:lysophospholipid acyltransferase family protein [Actinomycetota bacterium]
MIIFLGYKCLEFIAFITPYAISYFIANIAARMMYFLGIYVPVLKKNVANALDKDIKSKEVAKIVQKIYINWFLNVTDFLKHPLVSKEKFKKRIRLEGHENLDNALKHEKGAVIFTAHLGNFEWGACRLGVQGYKIWGTGLIRTYKRTNEFFEKRRLSKGLGTLYANKVMLNIFRILKNNEVIAIPTDFDPLGTANTYKFFGKDAFIPSGPVEIAMKSGAPLLPSFTWRVDKYNHYQVIEKPLELLKDDGNRENRKAIIRANMEKMIAVMEKYISEHIDQWELFHDIWAN